MKSMTGFGRARALVKGVTVEAQLSSINKRGQEISVNLPRELAEMEAALQEKLQKAFERGKLQLNVRFQTSARKKTPADIKKDFALLKAACKELRVPFQADAELVLELMQASRPAETALPNLEKPLAAAVAAAIKNCQSAQAQEGARLLKDFKARFKKLASLKAQAATLAADALPHQRARLLKNLSNAGLDIDTQDERVLKELALFADRVDVTEELTRIDSHLKAADKLINSAGSIGRQMEFLLQELQREWNTLGNKSVQVPLVQTALAAKNEIERLREQAANVA